MTQEQLSQGGPASQEAGPLSRSRAVKMVLLVVAFAMFLGFIALGTWQVYRLQWKLALIERVNDRVHATPVAAPAPVEWTSVAQPSHEYLRVRLEGRFLPQYAALVQATTELGAGFWLLVPLLDDAGHLTLINRGYVTPQAAHGIRSAREALQSNGDVRPDEVRSTVTGLLRISEPGGGFLRENEADGDRWYSRDVAAIGAARGLKDLAPYFIDADTTPYPGDDRLTTDNDRPVGGLTVIAFHNNHLVYALTWYALALMVLAAVFWVTREERKRKTLVTADHRD